VYSTDDWSLLKSWVVTDNKLSPMIQDLKFSPNNQYLAISCHDAKIYIYDANTLNKKAVCKASTSAVTHIDWSLDSQNLHSNDLSYEVLYYTANTGQQNLGGATVFKDEMWATYTVPLGWPSQGIWPPRADGSDVNSVDRSNNFHPDGYQLIATGDDFSKVKIFRYPSSEEGSQGLVGKGHSSHVTNVKFASNDQYLYSTGGNDTSVFRWKIRNSVA
jgi:WD40 repeat protein